MHILYPAALLVVAAICAAIFGPSVFVGIAIGVVIDRLLIVPSARALARNDRA